MQWWTLGNAPPIRHAHLLCTLPYYLLAPSMDTDTKRATYHTAAYHASGTAMMSFDPINQIHQHICAFHCYAYVVFCFRHLQICHHSCSTDRKRHVEAHHFCTHRSEDFHQCVIFDSGDKGARLIGIEYIVSEKVRNALKSDWCFM